MPRRTAPPPPGIRNVLIILGENLRLARLRRKITSTMLAERSGMTRNTLRSIEKGDGGVTFGAYASVLFCLGLDKDLLLIAKEDPLGRKLQDAELIQPEKRVIGKKG